MTGTIQRIPGPFTLRSRHADHRGHEALLMITFTLPQLLCLILSSYLSLKLTMDLHSTGKFHSIDDAL